MIYEKEIEIALPISTLAFIKDALQIGINHIESAKTAEEEKPYRTVKDASWLETLEDQRSKLQQSRNILNNVVSGYINK